MKRIMTAVLTVLAAMITMLGAPVAEAELRSEPWACYVRGYVLDLDAVRVSTSGVQPRSIRGRIQPVQQGAETFYAFALYDIAQNEWGMYLRYLINVTEVDEGFASMLAKAANGEVAVGLASYGGRCPKDGRPLRGANIIRLLDYDLEPVLEEPQVTESRG